MSINYVVVGLALVVGLSSAAVIQQEGDILGTTAVKLDGESCNRKECNLGNFLADALINAYFEATETVEDAAGLLAFIQGSHIKASVDMNANITEEKLKEILPIEDNLFAVHLNGSAIKDALTWSVNSRFHHENGGGEFLQVSKGVQVHYDFGADSELERVISVRIRCLEGSSSCPAEQVLDLNNTATYIVVLGEHLSSGKDGFDSLKGHLKDPRELKLSDLAAAKRYIQKMSPIDQGEEERISMDNVEMAVGAAATLYLSSTILALVVALEITLFK